MSKKLNKLSSHFESGMEEHTKSNHIVRIECRKWYIKLSARKWKSFEKKKNGSQYSVAGRKTFSLVYVLDGTKVESFPKEA